MEQLSNDATSRGTVVKCSCISLAQVQLFLFYLLMVSLNGLAVTLFERGATDGYALSYVQPDGKTFAIWGLIYTLLLLLVFSADRLYSEVRTKVCLAFLMNGLWLVVNGLAVNEGWSYWAAVSVLFTYAALLWNSYYLLNVNYAGATLVEHVAVYTPLSLNLAWVTLASILNFTNTAMNEKLDFSKRESQTGVGGPDWAMGVILLATILACYLAFLRSDYVYSLGTVWALQGIRRHQTDGSGFPHPLSSKLYDFANVLSIVVAIAAAVGFMRALLARPYSKATNTWRQGHDGPERDVIHELKTRFVPLNDSS